MKFNPGEYRRSIGGATYLKDASIPQVTPAPPVESQPKEEIIITPEPIKEPVKSIKTTPNEQIRSKQVEEKPAPRRSGRPKRKPSKPSI